MIIRSCRGTSAWLGRFISSLKSNFLHLWNVTSHLLLSGMRLCPSLQDAIWNRKQISSLSAAKDWCFCWLVVNKIGGWNWKVEDGAGKGSPEQRSHVRWSCSHIPISKTAISPLLSRCVTLIWDDLRIAFIQLMSNAAFEKSWYVPLPWNLELEKTPHTTWSCRIIIEIYVHFKTWQCLGNDNGMEVKSHGMLESNQDWLNELMIKKPWLSIDFFKKMLRSKDVLIYMFFWFEGLCLLSPTFSSPVSYPHNLC